LPISGSEHGISMFKGNNEFHNDMFLLSEDCCRIFFNLSCVSGSLG